jgi:DNA-binding SARP family transcriptional activator
MSNPLFFSSPSSRGEAFATALSQAIFNDDLKQGLKLSRQALRFKLNPELKMTILYGSAVIHHRLGNLSHARELLEVALAIPFVQSNERMSIVGYNILSTVLCLIGDYSAVVDNSMRLSKLSKKYNMLTDLGRAHRSLARMFFREGRFDEARLEFEMTIDFFNEAENNYSIYTALELMQVRTKTGESAKDLMPEAFELLKTLSGNPVGQGGDQYVQAVGGIIALDAGEIELAQQIIEGLDGYWRRKGAKLNQVGNQLLLSHIYLLQGKEKTSDVYLRKALAAAEAHQWINFWEWHDETIYTMCRRAILKNIHAAWAVHILNRWFPQGFRRDMSCLLVSPDIRLSSYAASLFYDYSGIHGKTIIHAFFLGEFRVFVNGAEVYRQNWKTQKAESLFKYLVSKPQMHPKEEIIEQLWPDVSIHSGDVNLRMALSTIRKALKVNEDNERGVIQRRGMVYLNPNIELYSDFDLFTSEAQKAVKYAESRSPYAANSLEQAVQYYGGEFLPEDIYSDWVNYQRSYLQSLFLQVLFKLSEVYYNNNHLLQAIRVCQKYLAIDPIDEPVIRLAMKIFQKTGQKKKAMLMYKDLATVLSSQYQTEPEPETCNLYHNL